MRHYSLTDQLYRSDVKNYNVAATEASQALPLATPSKTLFLRNDGPNDVFIAFDEDEAATADFKLAMADGLVKIDVQCAQVAMICNTGETAAVRVSSNF